MAETLNDAIALIRSGNRDSARTILKEVIRVEPHNVSAWLWFVETLPHDADKIKALEFCVQLNPQEQTAIKALQMLKERQSQVSAPAAVPEPVPQPAPVQAPVESVPPPAPVQPPVESAPPVEVPAAQPVFVPPEASPTPFEQGAAPVEPAVEPPSTPAEIPAAPFQQAAAAPVAPPPEQPVAALVQEPAAPSPQSGQAIPMPAPAQPVEHAQSTPSAEALPETPVQAAEALKAAAPPFPTGVEPPFVSTGTPKIEAAKSTLPEPVIETQDVSAPQPRRRRSLRWLLPAILISFLIFLIAGLGFLYIQYVINR
jgi:hypothetical protein